MAGKSKRVSGGPAVKYVEVVDRHHRLVAVLRRDGDMWLSLWSNVARAWASCLAEWPEAEGFQMIEVQNESPLWDGKRRQNLRGIKA